MPIPYDPELATALNAAASAAEETFAPKRGDALSLREVTNQAMKSAYSRFLPQPDVSARDVSFEADDGATIYARWYTPPAALPGSAVVYIHGGGMIGGSVELYDPMMRYYVSLTGVPFLAVDYRLAPEYTGTRPAQDCFEATRWLHSNAKKLHVDPNRVAVMGDSGGGGLAASVAIQARDLEVPLARQILIYPMLDDRNTFPDPVLEPTATWTFDNNFTGWSALLSDSIGSEGVSPIAAPARLNNFADLAPAYIEVGELDIFRDETLAYAASFGRAGVSCEFHMHPGAPHGHDWIILDSDLNGRVLADRVRVIRNL
ncbi:alpha/beta hydrolase [Rhodococcus ruber BKS 20-38]|uniref:Alpha/beta hydrolase n=1 Tax=Rhodococcus ruber BKS 20-38 TaxID=1278076 RepID=M2Z021_9NOCA|nr:alpha/beta hydrolase [Rhodococcus ruber]EME54283.1 alpha/beta hydrolase [Rhodococcus ruber BKS 20-38]